MIKTLTCLALCAALGACGGGAADEDQPVWLDFEPYCAVKPTGLAFEVSCYREQQLLEQRTFPTWAEAEAHMRDWTAACTRDATACVSS